MRHKLPLSRERNTIATASPISFDHKQFGVKWRTLVPGAAEPTDGAGSTDRPTSAKGRGAMLLKLAVSGLGIIRFGDIIVAEAVRSGRLIPLMENFQQPESFPLWAIFQRRRQRTPRVKAFVDYLMERFAGAPWRAGSTNETRSEPARFQRRGEWKSSGFDTL